MIKACFFDIDGTLYSHTTDRVPESAKNSLARLRENGIKTVGRKYDIGRIPGLWRFCLGRL